MLAQDTTFVGSGQISVLFGFNNHLLEGHVNDDISGLN